MTKLEKMLTTYQVLNIAKKKLIELDSTDIVIKNNIVKLTQSLTYIDKKIEVLKKLRS